MNESCWYCDYSLIKPVLGTDGCRYHGDVRCTSKPKFEQQKRKILLAVTGGVAAKLTPKLVKMLVKQGHEVQVVATEKALYFFPRQGNQLPLEDGKSKTPPPTVPLWTDQDEWTNGMYIKDQTIPHIALTQWADVFAIVPATANTLGKIAHGICDNLVTSEVMAWPTKKPLVIAPAMNTVMWQNPILQQNLLTIGLTWNVTWVSPVEKRLACGDVGVGALAPLGCIVDAILLAKTVV
jgi:phosphopantothenoylcysteine decarboxylase